MLKSTFAERLNSIIKERNIRQIDLCKATGIGKSAMSQYLHGSFEPKQQNLHALASALHVSEAWLMGYDVPREKISNSYSLPSSSDSSTEPDRAPEFFYYTATDSSMEGLHIPKGALIEVKVSQDFRSGQIVHFSIKNSPAALRTVYTSDDSIILTAASPSYEPIICKNTDLETGVLKINGVVSRVIIEF